MVNHPNRSRKGIHFGTSKPWNDRLGRHTFIDIYDGDTKIGHIEGGSGVAIPMMEYCVSVPDTHIKSRTFSRLDDAKNYVREEAKRGSVVAMRAAYGPKS